MPTRITYRTWRLRPSHGVQSLPGGAMWRAGGARLQFAGLASGLGGVTPVILHLASNAAMLTAEIS
jgi:hypothetical protein